MKQKIKHIEVDDRTHTKVKLNALLHGMTMKQYIAYLVANDKALPSDAPKDLAASELTTSVG